MLNLYSFFHVNLMFSAIAKEKRLEVIEKCYWPLLELAENKEFCISIESSALTLEIIAEICPDWILKLKELINSGVVEFIGSGYSQIIAPIVPLAVVEKNISLGNKIYK